MVGYNERVIKKYAGKLYRRANWVVFKYLILFAASGATIGASLANAGYVQSSLVASVKDGAFFGGLLFGVLGIMVGLHESFQLFFKAQLALCLAAIEVNTRPS